VPGAAVAERFTARYLDLTTALWIRVLKLTLLSEMTGPGVRFAEQNTPNQAEKRKKTPRPPPGMCVAIRPRGDRNPMSPSLTLINRVRSEFIEMPGLRLRLEQAQRLWNLDRASCEVLLTSLVDAKFLHRGHDDAYGRS
jgi:hypothetical protein